jgi:2-polyprenyl-6-methoxyphenol hydroxylase-like FAD-dependent oxidoreductase
MQSTTGKAVIVGAGVCGPVAAMALQRIGIHADVFEAYRDGGPNVGSYLTVATNGLDALRAIDAHTPVLKAGFPTGRTVLLSGTGKRLGVVPVGSTRPGRDGSVTIKRSELHRVLHAEAARRGIAIRFGKRLKHADLLHSGVRVEFEDGSAATGDMLIGCDGVHSATRAMIDPRAPQPRYVGLLNFGGYTAAASVGESNTWQMIFGAKAFFGFVPDLQGGTVWFANVPRRAAGRLERESTTVDQWKRWLIDLFADDSGPARDLIAAGVLQLAADNTHDLAFVPNWHKGAAIIVGDAAHAPSPSSGQGASMAIEDAVVLAQCLRDESDVRMAFALFERIRRQRVQRIVAQGARTSSSKAASAVGRVFRDLAMPWVLRNLVTEESMAWIYDHHIEWDCRRVA